MALPHIRNSKAGVNRWDPVHKCHYEVYFTIPEALQGRYQKDVADMLLTQQVKTVDGLGTLDPALGSDTQRFMGSTRTYLNPKPESTSHEISVTFYCNLRNSTDNFVYKLFRDWNKLGYDLDTGESSLKNGYTAAWMKVLVANRRGDVIKDVIFKDVMMTIEDNGLGSLDYTAQDMVEIKVKFWSDWADDVDA